MEMLARMLIVIITLWSSIRLKNQCDAISYKKLTRSHRISPDIVYLGFAPVVVSCVQFSSSDLSSVPTFPEWINVKCEGPNSQGTYDCDPLKEHDSEEIVKTIQESISYIKQSIKKPSQGTEKYNETICDFPKNNVLLCTYRTNINERLNEWNSAKSDEDLEKEIDKDNRNGFGEVKLPNGRGRATAPQLILNNERDREKTINSKTVIQEPTHQSSNVNDPNKQPLTDVSLQTKPSSPLTNEKVSIPNQSTNSSELLNKNRYDSFLERVKNSFNDPTPETDPKPKANVQSTVESPGNGKPQMKTQKKKVRFAD